MAATEPFTGPVVFAAFTTAQRDAISPLRPGLTIFNIDTGVTETFNGVEWPPLLLDPAAFDAIVDSDFFGAAPNVYQFLEQAIDDGNVAILIRKMLDDVDFTIDSGAAVERIAGVDLDVVITVNIIVEKVGMLLENFQLATKQLTLDAADIETRRLKITGTGHLKIETAARVSIRDTIVDGATAIPITIEGSGTDGLIAGLSTTNCTGASVVQSTVAVDGFHLTSVRAVGNTCTGYVLDFTPTGARTVLRDIYLEGVANGGITIEADDPIIDGLHVKGNISSGAHAVLATDDASPQFNGMHWQMEGVFTGGSLGFKYDGATAPNEFKLSDVYLIGVTLEAVDDMVFDNISALSGGIDFNNKSNVVVSGGDLGAGVTLSNVTTGDYKTATQFHGVRGQRDRGWFPEVAATKAAFQVITTATFTPIAFDAARYDNDSIHDPAVNNTRFTPSTPGTYQISAQIQWAAKADATVRLLRLKVNGTTYIAAVEGPNVNSAIFGMGQTVSRPFQFNGTTDYVEVEVYQFSGANLNINKALDISPECQLNRIGE